MLNLILVIFYSTVILVAFRIFERFKIDNFQSIIVNYFIAVVFGIMLLGSDVEYSTVHNQEWFGLSAVIGFFFIVVFNIFALSSQKVGIAVTAVSSKMSVVVPIIFSVIVFNESLNMITIVGIILALAAFYLTFKKKEKKRDFSIYYFLPVLLFAGNGVNDTLMKYGEETSVRGDTLLFLTTIFTFSLIIGLLFLIVKVCFAKESIRLKNIVAGAILGLLNFASTYYFLKSVTKFDSAVFFPIFNVSLVALSALIGFVGFKERLRPINWIGIVCAMIAILVIAIGS